MRTGLILAAWLTFSAGLGGYFANAWSRDDRQHFMPGPLSDGHYQIANACDACHTPFLGVRKDACNACHADELDRFDDSHPAAKFLDPRNAERVDALDARLCTTCHVEHRPAFTGPMTLSQPEDFCTNCHADIGVERASHADFSFNRCTDSGCHNFHDNRALNADFLRAHLDEPPFASAPRLPVRARIAGASGLHNGDDHATVKTVADWESSQHARAAVNCRDCHADESGAWTKRPERERCAECHDGEVASFARGRHGMRSLVELPPIGPGQARLPMREAAAHRELDCGSCHPGHSFDTREAAVEACLACHADEHSLAYEGSAHAELWRRELAGDGEPGTGVSCASCHLPRRTTAGLVSVDHNQSATLRPRDKLIRPVCTACHGLGFTLDALADDALVHRNFDGRPSVRQPSLDMISSAMSANEP